MTIPFINKIRRDGRIRKCHRAMIDILQELQNYTQI